MSGEQRASATAGQATAAAPVPEEATISEVPAAVRDAARRAFASRDRGAQVLDLETDSLLEPVPPSGPRRLVFGTAPGPQVHVTVLDAGAGRVRLEISSDVPGFEVLAVRSGTETAPISPADGPHQAAGPMRHGLLTVVLSLGHKRCQTAALRV